MHLTRLQFKPDPERQLGKSLSSKRQSRAPEAPPRLGPPGDPLLPLPAAGAEPLAAEGKATDVACTEIRGTSALNPGGFLLIAKSEGERFQERE